jgi:hypothetical protein
MGSSSTAVWPAGSPASSSSFEVDVYSQFEFPARNILFRQSQESERLSNGVCHDPREATPVAVSFSESANTSSHRQDSHRKREGESTISGLPNAKRTKEIVAPRLCEVCRSIDWNKVSNLSAADVQPYDDYDGVWVADFDSRNAKPRVNDCPICTILQVSLNQIKNVHQDFQLGACSFLRQSRLIDLSKTSKEFQKRICDRDLPCLAVTPLQIQKHGCLFRVKWGEKRASVFTPRILEPLANMEVCKEWLEYCKRHHQKLCGDAKNWPTSLRLIDCDTLEVVAASENLSYVALSYVWGSGNVQDESFPKTIRDAIAVTKALGYNFLWVDKYCINQNNSKEKHDQISQMDSVYNAADITIIAADGDGADAGLPGVLDTARVTHPVIEMGEFDLLYHPPHPYQTIRQSKWFTRGWTLQESVLSRRRLVFTQEQMYFECNAMNCCESLLEDRLVLHSNRNDKANRYCHSGVLAGLDAFASVGVANRERRFEIVQSLVEEYTKRNLTFEEDSLNGFAGIFRHFCNSSTRNDSFTHFWGIPCYFTPRTHWDVLVAA